MDNIEDIFQLPSDSLMRREALAHQSYARAGGGVVSNSRLSALGKPLTRVFLVEYLLDEAPNASGLSIEQRVDPLMERALVAEFAREELNLPGELAVGDDPSGEIADSVNVLANALFALVGASYSEAGFDAAKQAVYAYADHASDSAPATVRRSEHAAEIPDESPPTQRSPGNAAVQRFERKCEGAGLQHSLEYRGTKDQFGHITHEVAVTFGHRELVGSGPTREAATTKAAEAALILLKAVATDAPRTARPPVQQRVRHVDVFKHR
jgi:dsRNA-specific ribonuclease